MKIQRTSIVETGPNEAKVDLVISNQNDDELSGPHIVCSVLVLTEQEGRPVSFRVLQTRALDSVAALIQQAEAARRQGGI